MTRSMSVWKENFAIRKEIGYDKYKRLPKSEIDNIMRHLKSECNLNKRRHNNQMAPIYASRAGQTLALGPSGMAVGLDDPTQEVEEEGLAGTDEEDAEEQQIPG